MLRMRWRFNSRRAYSKRDAPYVAYARELDVSSCGGSKEKALRNLKEAVRLFLEEAEKMGTLDVLLGHDR